MLSSLVNSTLPTFLTPSPAPPRPLPSGPRQLLLYKFKSPITRLESTLLQVFFLKNLKPFGFNTYRKQGEGSLLWLTNCSKRVSIGLHSCGRHVTKNSSPQLFTFRALTNRDARNSFRFRSYENCRVTSLRPEIFPLLTLFATFRPSGVSPVTPLFSLPPYFPASSTSPTAARWTERRRREIIPFRRKYRWGRLS
jgi:hypothetical protein